MKVYVYHSETDALVTTIDVDDAALVKPSDYAKNDPQRRAFSRGAQARNIAMNRAKDAIGKTPCYLRAEGEPQFEELAEPQSID